MGNEGEKEDRKGLEQKWLIPVSHPKAIWIIPLIAFLYFLWVLAVFLSPSVVNIFGASPIEKIKVGPYDAYGNWMWGSWVGMGVIFYIFLTLLEILFLVNWMRDIEAEMKRRRERQFSIIDEITERMPPIEFAYPADVPGGVYADAVVDVDDYTAINLKTLMAKPCGVCEDRLVCWESYKDKMRYNYFLSNIDCRPGLDTIARGDVAPMKHPDAGAWKPDQPKQEMKAGGEEKRASTYIKLEEAPAPRRYPKIYADIERIEGIGPIRAKALREAGIKSTDDLEDADIEKLAEKTWIPERLLSGWRAMAELMHVEDVGQQFSEALVRSGVKSVEQLAASDPAKLAARIRRIIAGMGKRITQAPITDSRVATWVENAKKLLRQAAARAG